MKDLLDDVVHDEELPAHDEQEELCVSVRDQHLVNGRRELFVLLFYGIGLSLALLDNGINDRGFLRVFEFDLVKLLILVIGPE